MNEKDYLLAANEPGMWVVCSLVVLIPIIQAVIFMSKAYKTGHAIGLTSKQLNSSIRSGIISSIGPSLAIAIAMVSLMVSLGGPIVWARFSVVGSVPFELMAAATGAETMGATLGGENYNLTALANSVWTCTLGASGWLLICALFTHKFNDLRMYIVQGNEALLPVLSISAMIGAFAYFGAPYLALRGTASTASYLTGAVTMVIVHVISNRCHQNWLKEWSLGIAMLCGMFAALLFI